MTPDNSQLCCMDPMEFMVVSRSCSSSVKMRNINIEQYKTPPTDHGVVFVSSSFGFLVRFKDSWKYIISCHHAPTPPPKKNQLQQHATWQIRVSQNPYLIYSFQ